MPIKIQNDLPVKEILEKENLFVVDENRATHQDIRPLQLCILNLMPKKEETELQLLRMLSNTPLQIDITFMRMSSHKSLNTPISHLQKFYYTFEELREQRFDGLIITGAPVEKMEYEEVDYWPELCDVFAWSKTNVFSTFHICWGAQAGLYYHYGLKKRMLSEKLFGVYSHKVRHRREPGHAEYDRNTLRDEYFRDARKGLGTAIPINYFPDDNPDNKPLLEWRAHSYLLYSNWLNYYVYQRTPYDLNEIR